MTILTLQIQVSDNMFSVCYSHKPRGINQILRILGRSSFVLQTQSFTQVGLKVSDLEGCLNRIKFLTFSLPFLEWICLLFAQKCSDPKDQGIVDTPPPVCVSVTFFTGGITFSSTLGGMRHFVPHTSHIIIYRGTVWRKWVTTLWRQCGKNRLPHFWQNTLFLSARPLSLL